MDNITRRDNGLVYISDETVMEEQKRTRILNQKLNTVDRWDFEAISEIVKELLGKSDGAFINPPFYCDYGTHIEVGKNFFANYNCTIIDVAKVKIGDNCQLAPNVAIYTAGHPVHPDTRNTLYEYGKEVTIGDNVWIGGNPCKVVRPITEEDRRLLASSDFSTSNKIWRIISKNSPYFCGFSCRDTGFMLYYI